MNARISPTEKVGASLQALNDRVTVSNPGAFRLLYTAFRALNERVADE
jgi:hypothetical protein